MTAPPILLLLFDIDGTLMVSGGAGSRAIDRAVETRFGVRNAFAGITPDGKTDPLLFREVIERHKLGDDPTVEAELTGLYLRYFPDEMARSPRARLLRGVSNTLETLAARSDLALGILTGNLEASAHVKLTHFGIDRHFRFGAFGSDSPDRVHLVPVAVTRAERALGRAVGLGRHVVVIGDTPRDVACALANGATAIGVATHRYGRRELRDAGAHAVLSDLLDAEALLEAARSSP